MQEVLQVYLPFPSLCFHHFNAFILCPDKPFQHVKDIRLQLANKLMIGDYCSHKQAGRGIGR